MSDIDNFAEPNRMYKHELWPEFLYAIYGDYIVTYWFEGHEMHKFCLNRKDFDKILIANGWQQIN